MNYFINCDSIESLRKEFKKLAFKLHPDRGGNKIDFQNMQNEFESKLKQFSNESNEQNEVNYSFEVEFSKVVNELLNYEILDLEICGSWLWIRGCNRENKTLQSKLLELGCIYHVKKTCWYFCDKSVKKKFRTKETDMNEIRLKYGSQELKKVKNKIKTV